MNCADVRSRGYDYFEHKLATGERAAVDAHVASCAECAELWAKAREMNCRDFAAGCGELTDGELTPERRRLFERHLSICRACRTYLATYEAAVELSRRGARIDEAELTALEDRLIDSILAARRRGD